MNSFIRILLLPGIFLIGFSFNRSLGVTFYDVFIISSFLLWVIFGFRGFETSFLKNGIPLAFALAMFGYLISLPMSSNVLDSVAQLSKFVFSVVVFFVFFPSIVARESDWIKFGMATALSGALNGLGAILQATVGLGAFGSLPFWGRMTGFTEHPNELGFNGAISVFACFVIFALSKSKLEKFFILLMMIFSSCGLVLSSSISCTAALIGGGAVVALLEAKNGRFAVAKGLVAVGTIMLAAIAIFSVFNEDNSIIERISAQSSLDTDDGTLGQRFITYELAYERILDNPFLGVGNSEDDTLSQIGDYVHNMFLRAFREGGVFSFIGMLLIYYYVVQQIILAYRFDTTGNYLFGFIIVVFLCASFSPAFFQRMYWLPFGLIISAVRIRNS